MLCDLTHLRSNHIHILHNLFLICGPTKISHGAIMSSLRFGTTICYPSTVRVRVSSGHHMQHPHILRLFQHVVSSNTCVFTHAADSQQYNHCPGVVLLAI